ncbi:MAG TPA: DNA gyrase modulator, partial [Rugosibacter sp.]|nr:DNA gyrase modulator [Rugosibacter sp.]
MPRRSAKDSAFSFSQEALRNLAQSVLDHAKKHGATACEVDVSEGLGQSISVRRQAVETIEYNRDKGLGVTVYIGQRRGHASSSDFSPSAVKDTVAAALSIARFTAEDDCAGLPDVKLLAKKSMDLDLFHPWNISVDEAIALAQRCEQGALDVSPLISNSEGATVSAQQSQFIAANSLGFMDGFASTRHYVSCSVIAGTGDDMQRDDWYTSSRDAQDFSAVERIGDYAARRA